MITIILISIVLCFILASNSYASEHKISVKVHIGPDETQNQAGLKARREAESIALEREPVYIVKKEGLKNYRFQFEQNLFFEFSEEQIRMRDDYFKRYGTSINAISKIVTRVSGLEGQYRKVRLEKSNELRSIYRKVGEALPTKYAMSG